MTIDPLRILVEQAATELAERATRPYPPTVVLPLEGSTKVISLDGFPDDDAERADALSVLAARQMVPANAACFGFIAEAESADGDVLLVVYGARQRGAMLTAAMLGEEGLASAFVDAEPLEPTALPFVQPLQHAADTASPSEPPSGGLPIIG